MENMAIVQEGSKRIETLQAVRAVAFMGVFASHTGFTVFSGAGMCGVSIFLILSGFVMILGYYKKERIKYISIKYNTIFVYKKINSLFFLHVFTTLVMFPFLFLGNERVAIFDAFIRLILNLFMIDEWLPLCDRVINGVSWYLCVIVFSYFIFPWILRYMEKKYCKKKAVICICFSILVEVFIGLVGKNFPNDVRSGNRWLTHNMTNWFIYYFPLSRIWDFIIGCNLGYLFLHNIHNLKKIIYSAVEIVSILFVGISNFVCLRIANNNTGGV